MHELPELPYAYDALEPYIDAKTMEIHHSRHHQAYVDKLNKALEGTGLEGKPAEELIKDLNSVPEEIRQAVRNNGGGHVNHSFFWPLMKKGVEPAGEIYEAIKARWGSFENFREEFTQAAVTRFGSGWAWLVVSNGQLEIVSTPNQDSPLSEGKTPVLGIDVWEHAYYIKYLWNRAEYVKNWWNVVNWEKVNEHFRQARI
jgi:Fe-Mn family superoxide dismutase